MIINAILLKFTEQIGPYVFKRVKKNQLKQDESEAKVSDVIKQTKTLTRFEVITHRNELISFNSSIGNLWGLSDHFRTIWLCLSLLRCKSKIDQENHSRSFNSGLSLDKYLCITQ